MDDEPRIVDVVRAYLEREGHAVTVAHDGDAALAAAREAAPDLVVLDVMLPGRSGFDVLRALRAESDPGINFINMFIRLDDDVKPTVEGLVQLKEQYFKYVCDPSRTPDSVSAARVMSAPSASSAPASLASVISA